MGRPPKAPPPPGPELGTQDPEEMRLDRILDGLEGEGFVKVSRRDEKGVLRYAGRLPLADDFGEETVRDAFGGGRFYLRFYTGGAYQAGTGMEIEGPPKLSAPAATPPATPGPGVADVQRFQEGAAGGNVSLLVEVARLRGLVEGLTASMGTGGGGAGGGALGQLKDVAEVVRSLMPGAAPTSGGDPTKVFELARAAIDFGKEVSGGGDGDGGGFPWSKVIDEGVRPLVALATDQARKTAGAAPAGAPAAAPAAPTHPATEAATKMLLPPGVPRWGQMLVAEAPFLLQMAREEMDPRTVADLLLARWEKNMTDAEWEAFATTVADPTFVEQTVRLAAQFIPGAAAVAPWLTAFCGAVVEDFATQGEDEPAPGTPGAPTDAGGGGAKIVH